MGDNCGKFTLLSPNSIKIYTQAIALYYEPDKDKKSIFDSEVVSLCKAYEARNSSEAFDGMKKLRKHCENWYKKVREDSEESDDKCAFFYRHARFFSNLDGKFHSLQRASDESNSDAKRIKNAYLTIFIMIMKQRYRLDDESCKDFSWHYEDIFQLLCSDDKSQLYKEENQDSYYRTLSTALHKHNTAYRIVTTNYTDLVEIAENSFPVAFLHGRLNWFEDLEKLTVYDCTDERERKLALENEKNILPFIMISSGVKPIICRKQMEEYHRFISYLKESDTLCIVGYRFNPEDNHINSMIADWLRDDKQHRLFYFNYSRDIYFEKFNWVDSSICCNLEYTDDMEKFFSRIPVKDKQIYNFLFPENEPSKFGRELFRAFLSFYEQQ